MHSLSSDMSCCGMTMSTKSAVSPRRRGARPPNERSWTLPSSLKESQAEPTISALGGSIIPLPCHAPTRTQSSASEPTSPSNEPFVKHSGSELKRLVQCRRSQRNRRRLSKSLSSLSEIFQFSRSADALSSSFKEAKESSDGPWSPLSPKSPRRTSSMKSRTWRHSQPSGTGNGNGALVKPSSLDTCPIDAGNGTWTSSKQRQGRRFACPPDKDLQMLSRMGNGWSSHLRDSSHGLGSTLEESEWEAILAALEKAEVHESIERRRIGFLIQEVEEMKLQRKVRSVAENQCHNCGLTYSGLAWYLSIGFVMCEGCHKYVCRSSQCMVEIKSRSGKTRLVCRLCSKLLDVWSKCGVWFHGGIPGHELADRETLMRLTPLAMELASNGTPMVTVSKPSATSTPAIDDKHSRVYGYDPKRGPGRRHAQSGHQIGQHISNHFTNHHNGNHSSGPESQPTGLRKTSSPHLSPKGLLHKLKYHHGHASEHEESGDSLSDEKNSPIAAGTAGRWSSNATDSKSRLTSPRRALGNLRVADTHPASGSPSGDEHPGADLSLEGEDTLGPLESDKRGKFRSRSLPVSAVVNINQLVKNATSKHEASYEAGAAGLSHPPLDGECREDSKSKSSGSRLNSTYLGSIDFMVEYKSHEHELVVTVAECKDLTAMDFHGASDPFVRLQLLPYQESSKGRTGKHQTTIKKRTLNPEYFEDFTYYGIEPSEVRHLILRLTVYDHDTLTANDFLGEVIFRLQNVQPDILLKYTRLLELSPRLRRESVEVSSLHVRSVGLGKLLVSLCYLSEENQLRVGILRAAGLPAVDLLSKSSDPYVKCYLLPDKEKNSKRRTSVCKRTLNPVFNEYFSYQISARNLTSSTLEISVWDYNYASRNTFIGYVELSSTAGPEVSQWLDALCTPNEQFTSWYSLCPRRHLNPKAKVTDL